MAMRLFIGGVAALVGMVAGSCAGAIYAGNHAPDFEFLGGRRYEAGIALGGLAGLALGLIAALVVRSPWGNRGTGPAGGPRLPLRERGDVAGGRPPVGRDQGPQAGEVA
jgi:hypothetical protein